ncbi:MAG: hypothetical protein C0631_00230 [Sedimenticola sp.]|nr:MAG: hypothetical protein C0631_00230 [Sedimenticola sp.]
MSTKQPPLEWEINIPLVTNPLMLGAWVKAMGATYLVSMLILSAIFIGTGEVDGLPLLAGWFALITAGLTVAGLLIMLVVFGNRFRARFTVSDKGIGYEGIDTRARALARMSVVAGALGGSPRTAGAGLLAISNERVDLAWSGAFAARYRPRQHTVVLRNQWRDLLHVYCTADNYEAVKSRVSSMLSTRGTETRLEKHGSPLPGALFSTLLVVAACLPLFALNEITGLDIFVPLLVMLFSLATVWLIPLFGWVILPLLGYILIHLVVALSGVRELKLVSTYRFRAFELLDGGEWMVLILGLVGISYLAVISVRALRGRLVPVLFQDYQGHGQ